MKGRVVLVTGGTGGIGTAICRKFADRGAIAVATYSHLEKTNTKRTFVARNPTQDGYEFAVASIDVTTTTCAERFLAMLKKAWDRLIF